MISRLWQHKPVRRTVVFAIAAPLAVAFWLIGEDEGRISELTHGYRNIGHSLLLLVAILFFIAFTCVALAMIVPWRWLDMRPEDLPLKQPKPEGVTSVAHRSASLHATRGHSLPRS
jgi:hypothetical protein